MKSQLFRIAIIDGRADAGRAGFAMLESSHSFYAAEAGINQIWGTWGDATDSTVAAMSPGDTLDLGWQTLNSGSSHRGQVVRTDAGADQPTYVRVSGDWALGDNTGGYAQGLFVMDTSTTADLSDRTTETGVGSEFDIEGYYPWEVAGIVVGRGCFEMDTPDGGGIHRWFGAAFSDGFIKPNLNCDGDEPFYMHSNTEFRYSQCVVQNVLKISGAGQSEAAAHGLIQSRARREILR